MRISCDMAHNTCRSVLRKCLHCAPALVSLLFFLAPVGVAAQDTFDTLQKNVWYLPTADGKAFLYVTSLGKGPPVIVLHGGPGNDFNYLVDAVRAEGPNHQFILYDQRGSLLSPVSDADRKTLTATTMVEDLDLLRRTLGQEKVVLLGHSWGTFLAMLYYQAHPEHVSALVLMGCFPPRTEPGADFDREVKVFQDRQRALRQRPVVSLALKAAGVDAPLERLGPKDRWTHLRIEAFAGANLYHVERWAEFQGEGIYYSEKTDSAIGDSLPKTFDIAPTLAKFPVPVTVIQGDTDYLDPSAHAWDYLKPNKNVKTLIVFEASHYSWVDNPVQFKADLHEALRRSF